MRTFITATLFGLFLAVTAVTQQAQAQSATFCFTNSSSSVIYLRLFSTSRNAFWGNYVLSDRVRRCATLSCVSGEQICYGGTNNAGTYWGVGYDANSNCSNCCGQCDNSEYNINLTD